MAKAKRDEEFTFVSPVVKYLLFLFNMLFWIIALALISIGVYSRIVKHAETVLACLTVDPALLLMIVGVLMFFVTFCGCVGSLRENICLLQTFCIILTIIFLMQLVAGVLGFVFSDKARGKVTEMVDSAIKHYRDDLDLQNLIDYGQKQFNCCGGVSYMDWSQNMYFNCSKENPSRERCSVPFSCCLLSKVETVINTMCGHRMQELEYVSAGAFINTNGCIDNVVNWIHSNLFLLGGIALGLAIPQLEEMKTKGRKVREVKMIISDMREGMSEACKYSV
ncbi:tetraspanin-33 isoform X3 [Siphateles boraxobius]|uniref:tetraspanin-33 isoform X3 n=1 Tax=Siphateles boraxobius TaxID=180520 RepID=UPI00406456BE